MKFLMLTAPSSDGISEVFHSIVLPEDKVPAGMIDRWQSIIDASPMTVMTVSGKENVAVNSVWDEESETFTMGEGVPAEVAKPINQVVHVFLVNNVIAGLFTSSTVGNIPNAKYTAAFSAPISVVGLDDDSPVDLGYTFDGTSFSAPADI